jgi:hypothetical protein
MKKFYALGLLVVIAIVFQSNVKYSSIPPEGYTGASGDYCVDCHSSFALNSGGSVTASGLPTGTYTAGTSYPFTIAISHSVADRKRWGFSIAAVDNSGNALGTFSTTNSHAINNGAELSHFSAVVTASSSSYTYTSLTWTAPTSFPTSNHNVTFYYVGNAANNDGTNQNDYIYSGSKLVALPIAMKSFTASVQNNNVRLNWETSTEINSDYFDIEKSDNGQTYYSIGKINASGNTTTSHAYTFTDANVSYYSRTIFYRLKLMDKDGKSTYSDVVTTLLKAPSTQVINFFPSMIKSGMNVTAIITSDKAQKINMDWIDVNGRVLRSSTIDVITGSNKIILSSPYEMQAGQVFARFTGDGFKQTIPAMVMR